MPRRLEPLPVDDKPLGVPKIIMQTWKTHAVPDKWKESPASIRRLLPDWKYVLMSDDDNEQFVRTHYPDFLSTYLAFPHAIQRADAIRPLWLKKHGGVYLDLDYVLQRPLDELFDDPDNQEVPAFFVRSGNISQTLTNSFMASKAGAAVWDTYIDEMRHPETKWWTRGKHLQVMMTTGPYALDRAVKRSATNYRLLPHDLINPCSLCDNNCASSKHAVLRQLTGGSWNGADSRAYNWVFCNRRRLQKVGIAVGVAVVLGIIVIIFFRVKT